MTYSQNKSNVLGLQKMDIRNNKNSNIVSTFSTNSLFLCAGFPRSNVSVYSCLGSGI